MTPTGNLYTDLADYYDQFCADVDYAEQCAFACRVFDCFATSGGRDYFDLACGTGQHLRYMADHGFAPSGLDNSAEMLRQAGLRCPQANLFLCDLAAFEHVDEFDLITCFLYSIHYSHPVSALTESLRRAFRALKPGGVFIFNAVDARGIRNDSFHKNSGITTRLTDGDCQLSFQSAWNYRGEGEVLDLNLCITRGSPLGTERWNDHHTMTAITFPQLQQLLEQEGFDVTLLEHDYTVIRAWDGASFNVLVVACKSAHKV